MPCGPFQILEISDGTTTVNLLAGQSGFCLLEWEPALAEPKGGGVWRDSQLAEGRWLAMRPRANAMDTLTLAVRDWTPDDLIRDTQDLRRLLEKAYAYDTTQWQDEPVWIKRHPVNATYAEYSIIHDYRTPQDGNPHGSSTFWTALRQVSFPEFVLVLEHDPWWTANQPGTGTCAQASGQQEDWEYEPWAVNTALPGNLVWDMIELSSGRILATDNGGAGQVWRTDDGGATAWLAAATPPLDPYALLEASDGFVYAAGCGAGPAYAVYRSGDGGVNWAPRNNTVGALQHHCLTEHTDGYLYLADYASSNIVRSNDGGLNWGTVYSDSQMLLVMSASDGYLYAAGPGWLGETVIVRSQNGTTWDIVFVHADLFWGSTQRCIREPGDGYIYVGASGGAGGTIQIWRSPNGTDWALVYENPTLGFPPGDILYASDGYYYMASSSTGRVYKAVDPMFFNLVVDIGTNAFSLLEWSGNNRVYVGGAGDIWRGPRAVTVGRTATCADEVFVANKQNRAQLTHVKTYDASEAPPDDYLDRFPAGAFPYQLLPAALANNDAVYFGIETAVFDGGPFNNVILDLIAATKDFDITWQYSDGVAGWPNLNAHDATFGFSQQGVCGVYWVPPTDWVAELVDGVTAYWVRAIVSNVAGAPAGPQQDNRDPYTVNWPRADVDDAQVPGDIPALLRFKFYSRADEDGYESTIDELDLLENRVIVGLRSLDRGPQFTAFLNCADEQNPLGMTAANGAATLDVDDIDHPTGRSMRHTTTGLSTWTDECIFILGPTIARDFYGSFHAYLRAKQVARDAVMDEVRVRLQIRTGSGGVTATTDHKPFRNLNDWQLIDFGGVDIPASGLLSSSDLGDETELAVQIWSSVADLYVNLYDLVLIPTDEWALDAVDKAMEDDSGVANGYFLDTDSVTYPKRDIRALVRQVGGERIRSVYQPNTPGPAVLQANTDQRLWFLTARGCVLGAHTGANDQPVLTDANASFLTSGVEAGHYVYNLTDTVWGIISAVTATTVTATTLAGAAFDWDTGEEYLIVCPNWRSEPWNSHSIQVWANARYLSMRGAR